MSNDDRKLIAAEGVVLTRLMGDRQNGVTELKPELATRIVNYLANSTALIQEIIAAKDDKAQAARDRAD